nr:hypothetical protein [Fredinandcohnia onubensis]
MNDVELILSWTPREYRAFIKGAQQREIDEYERMARSAMFNRYAMNAKRASERKMFDAEKARKRLNEDKANWKNSRDMDMKRLLKLNEAFKGFTPQFRKKGGST